MNDKTKSIIVLVLEVLLGCTFIFSGYAKAVDAFGGYYKIIDYLTAFGWDWLKVLGFFGSILLSAAEFALGVCMLLGVLTNDKHGRPWVTYCMILFMVVFTPLTLYLAINNPVTDCGCFGDALVISNWQTFGKNIVIDIVLAIVYFWRNYRQNKFSLLEEISYIGMSVIFAIGLSVYGLDNLPLIDFRPYYIGANIPKQMEVPEGAPKDVYKTTLIYEKDGKQQEFTMENYPKDTTEWKFVDNKSELVEKGYVPPIHDFTMDDPDDGDITDDVVYDPGYIFLLVMHNTTEYNLWKNPAGAHYDCGDKVNAVYEYAKAHNYRFYAMTATGLESDEIEAFKNASKAEYPFVNTDEITLKTIIRSSPGLLLIQNGNILNKWSLNNIPTFNEPLDQCELGKEQAPNNTLRVAVSAIILIIMLSIVRFTFMKIGKKEDK